jgi:hypothetical protein
MKKVKFQRLDGENKLIAISQMLESNTKTNWPESKIWADEEDVKQDLEKGYKPDEHFSFYVNEFGEVETKIG